MSNAQGPAHSLVKAIGLCASLLAIAFFWRSSLNIFFFTDDWKELGGFASHTGVALWGFLFEPHHEHFMPLFKAVYYIQYRFFGLDQSSFHITNFIMFGLSAVLLYAFLFRETGDRLASGVPAFLYAINSTYHNVVSWVFLEQMVMAMAFMLMALLSASREAEKIRPLYLAAFFSLLSSLSFGIGITSVLVVALYFLLKPSPGRQPSHMLPLGVVLLLYGGLYLKFGAAKLGGIGEGASPLTVLTDTAITIGDMIVKTFGVSLTRLTGLAADSTTVMAVNACVFAVYLLLTFFIIGKVRRETIHLSVLGGLMMMFFAAFIMYTRAGAEGIHLPGIDRYKYFPFLGFAITLAPAVQYLRNIKGKARDAVLPLLVLLLGVLAIIHHGKIEARYYTDLTAESLVRMTEQNLSEGGTRYINDLGVINLGHIKNLDYSNFVKLLKQPEDRVVRFRGSLLLLKTFEEIPPSRWTPVENPEGVTLGKNCITLRPKGEKPVSLHLKGVKTGDYGHLYFRMSSDRPFNGLIHRIAPDGTVRSTEFGVQISFFSREYLLACPEGEDIVLVVGPAKALIGDMRVYR